MRIIALAFVLITLNFGSVAAEGSATDTQAKAILITGASSGIGRTTAEYLASKGYVVFAGARKDADIEELNEIENITAIRLDVTKQDQIDAAVRQVEKAGHGLWGVVNNAGVLTVAPVTATDIDDFHFLFDVNVYGVMRISKAFAPLILESKGRIINISSVSGILTGWDYSAYSSSKHAVEAITDAMGLELGEHGVHVAAVNPGNFSSRLGASYCKRVIRQLKDANWGLFDDRRKAEVEYCETKGLKQPETPSKPPILVAKTVEQALFEDQPRERYLVAQDPLDAGWTIAMAASELLRMNYGHEFSYTREQLIDLIDTLTPYHSGENDFEVGQRDKDFEKTVDGWLEQNKK